MNSKLLKAVEMAAAKLRKRYPDGWRFDVELMTNNFGTNQAEDVWDVVAHDASGETTSHVAECGAAKCDGTEATAMFIAAALNAYVGGK